MTTLSIEQQVIISQNDITVEQDSATGNYIYLIAGVYNQQKGATTEYEAYSAAIKKVINK